MFGLLNEQNMLKGKDQKTTPDCKWTLKTKKNPLLLVISSTFQPGRLESEQIMVMALDGTFWTIDNFVERYIVFFLNSIENSNLPKNGLFMR